MAKAKNILPVRAGHGMLALTMVGLIGLISGLGAGLIISAVALTDEAPKFRDLVEKAKADDAPTGE